MSLSQLCFISVRQNISKLLQIENLNRVLNNTVLYNNKLNIVIQYKLKLERMAVAVKASNDTGLGVVGSTPSWVRP